MLLSSHGTCMATAVSCRGHMQVYKPWDMDMLGPRAQMPRHGVRGRTEGRRSALFVSELLNLSRVGAKELRWGALPWL